MDSREPGGRASDRLPRQDADLTSAGGVREQSGDDLARLLAEQEALRRVATLVARGVPATELFAAVTMEVGRLLAVESTLLVQIESGEVARLVGGWTGRGQPPRLGERLPLGGNNLVTLVARTHRPARMDDYPNASGPLGSKGRERGNRSGVATPVTVEGHLWGTMIASTAAETPLPSDTELRLASFTELLATAIANAENRADLQRLVAEQAALRGIATLVARGVAPNELFRAVTAAAGQVTDADIAALGRFEPGDTVIYIASWSRSGDSVPVGGPYPLGGENLSTLVASGGHPVRIDRYGESDADGALGARARALGARSGVATPITVDGSTWGAMTIFSTQERPLPPDTESRLEAFTDMLGTAIANAGSRAGLARLAQEQAALRRVATLVARGVPAEHLFTAVTEEAGQLLGAEVAALARYEPDGTASELARWSAEELESPILDRRWTLEGENVPTRVARTGRSARIDGVSLTGAPIDAGLDAAGIRSQVGTPVIVDRQLWGVVVAGSRSESTLPPDAEERLADFTDLLATAIANADSRAELAASRARIVAAADDTRRRIERDLHDGAQQRLVSLGLELRAVRADLGPAPAELEQLLTRMAGGLTEVQAELREIARGIHPAILADGGLGPALRTLARRSQIPVEITVQPHPRLPAQIEVAAYYVVSEALTNAAKHGHPSLVEIDLMILDDTLNISVHDDGPGGADPARGSGLVGLKDRVEAVGGTLTIQSPPGAGTTLAAELPIAR